MVSVRPMLALTHASWNLGGSSPLVNKAPLYGYDAPRDRAVATVLRAFAGPVNLIDTSNNYGGGDSERQIGEAIAAAGGVLAGRRPRHQGRPSTR